jgi:hypothetical protein
MNTKRDRLISLLQHLQSLTTAGFVLWLWRVVDEARAWGKQRVLIRALAWLQVYLVSKREILSAGIMKLVED